MDYITVHFASDNSQVSAAGDFTNPISFRLRLDLNQEDQVRLYAQTQQGYVSQNTVVQIVGLQAQQSTDRWQLAPDVDGTPGTYGDWGAQLELGTVGYDSQRVYFWVKARQTDTEQIKTDTTVGISVSGIVEAV